MSYKLSHFGTKALPTARATPDVGSGPSLFTMIDLPGGLIFDESGAQAAPRGTYKLRFEAMISEATASAADTAYQAFRALRGTHNQLKRTRQDAGVEWVYARLDQISATRRPEDVATLELEFLFTVESRVWSGTARTPAETLDGGDGDDVLVCPNLGDAIVKNAVLTVKAGTQPLHALTFTITGETSITYSGTIAAGKSLIIDVGAKTVENNGTGDYAPWDYSANVIDDWFRIAAGGSISITLAYSGGTPSDDGTFSASYYDAHE